MAKDAPPTSPSPFTAALTGFRRWTRTTKRRLVGDAGTDADELRILFDLMRDYLDIDRPANLGPGDLEELLLRLYPRKITVLDGADAEDTIPAIRDFLAYLADTSAMPEGTVRTLERELDRIAPQFAEAVMDPSNWGMARSLVQAMAADGVDLDDQAAVDHWIAAYNTGLDDFADEYDDDVTDIKDGFGLPDQLPPMRLPPDAELAALAHEAPMVGQLRALAAWLEAGRPVTENAELAGGDAAAAAAALGLDVPSAEDDQALPGLTHLPAVGRMRDVPRLDYLWRLALDAGFIELDDDETHAVRGEVARDWPDSDDDEVLEAWNSVFALVLDTLDIAASLDQRRSRELDFFGQGVALAVMLFLARPDGLPVTEVSEMIRSAAVTELAPVQAAKAWQSWVRAHGDPAQLWLGRMSELGAVRVSDSGDGDVVWLTPLAVAAVRTQLVDAGVEIPLLPPAEQMTAADLIAMTDGVTEEEFKAETDAWLSVRTPESAAVALLSVAAESDASSRMIAVALVIELGVSAELAWRDALDRIELRGYAKTALAALAADDPAATDVPAGCELADDDLAWLLTDALVIDGWDDMDDDAENESAALAERLREAIPAGEEAAAFEMMARVPHPDAANVLTMIGKYHPDKRMAKLARKSAYKAASRQVTAQRR
jgi:hypothetical protein